MDVAEKLIGRFPLDGFFRLVELRDVNSPMTVVASLADLPGFSSLIELGELIVAETKRRERITVLTWQIASGAWRGMVFSRPISPDDYEARMPDPESCCSDQVACCEALGELLFLVGDWDLMTRQCIRNGFARSIADWPDVWMVRGHDFKRFMDDLVPVFTGRGCILAYSRQTQEMFWAGWKGGSLPGFLLKGEQIIEDERAAIHRLHPRQTFREVVETLCRFGRESQPDDLANSFSMLCGLDSNTTNGTKRAIEAGMQLTRVAIVAEQKLEVSESFCRLLPNWSRLVQLADLFLLSSRKCERQRLCLWRRSDGSLMGIIFDEPGSFLSDDFAASHSQFLKELGRIESFVANWDGVGWLAEDSGGLSGVMIGSLQAENPNWARGYVSTGIANTGSEFLYCKATGKVSLIAIGEPMDAGSWQITDDVHFVRPYKRMAITRWEWKSDGTITEFLEQCALAILKVLSPQRPKR